MKTILPAVFSLLFCTNSYAQETLKDFNRQRQKINKNGLLVLGSWSAANIIYGGIASAQTSGSARYFHQMNAIWNTVTISLATVGLLTRKNNELSYTQSLQQQSSVEKVFLANAAFDVAYVAGGLYIKEKSKTETANANRSKGFGESIMLQGSALLLFDALMYHIHNRHGKALYAKAEGIRVGVTANGLGLIAGL